MKLEVGRGYEVVQKNCIAYYIPYMMKFRIMGTIETYTKEASNSSGSTASISTYKPWETSGHEINVDQVWSHMHTMLST